MIEVDLAFTISVFIAGVFMFLAPCTLPLVPAYLAFISGVSTDELQNPATRSRAKRTIIVNGIAFVLGFTCIFVGFGLLIGLLGGQLGQFRNLLAQIGGGFIIIFGLMLLNLIKINFLLKEHRLKIPAVMTPGTPASAFGIGATFALGWSPCVGPVLAAVLLLAAKSATALSGAFLLSIFSLGLAVPFLLTAFLYSHASSVIARAGYLSQWISYIGGVFLIFLGFLLLTGNFGFLIEYGYIVFNFFGFEGIYDLL